MDTASSIKYNENMTKKKKIAIGVTIIFLIALFARFVYYNIIVPWPYREGLDACLEKAESKETDAEIFAARNICFRKYPHFN